MEGGLEYQIPDVTLGGDVTRLVGEREQAFGRVRDVFLHIVGVSTLCSLLVEGLHHGFAMRRGSGERIDTGL